MATQSCLLISYRSWDELDLEYDRISNMNIPGVTLHRAYNLEGPPYPFTLAIVKNETHGILVIDFLALFNIDLATDKRIYADELELIIKKFSGMVPLDGYVPGWLKIQYGRCPLHGISSMACFLCPGGHATECHYPLDCQEANCSHLVRYNEDVYEDPESGLILENGICCICAKPLSSSKFVNMGMLNKRATWNYPTWGNVLLPGSGGRAVCFVCDTCQESEKKGTDPGHVKYAVEISDSEYILHSIEELEDLPAIKGKGPEAGIR